MAQLVSARDAARGEYARAPSDDDLLRWHAENNAAERRRREAQERLGEAESKLAQADHALARARDGLASDARDLNLPAVAAEIDEIEARLGDYQGGGHRIRQRASPAQELPWPNSPTNPCAKTRRVDHWSSAVEDHREKQKLLSAAAETAATLQATVGKQVSELLAEIESTQRAQQEHERALKEARAQLWWSPRSTRHRRAKALGSQPKARGTRAGAQVRHRRTPGVCSAHRFRGHRRSGLDVARGYGRLGHRGGVDDRQTRRAGACRYPSRRAGLGARSTRDRQRLHRAAEHNVHPRPLSNRGAQRPRAHRAHRLSAKAGTPRRARTAARRGARRTNA